LLIEVASGNSSSLAYLATLIAVDRPIFYYRIGIALADGFDWCYRLSGLAYTTVVLTRMSIGVCLWGVKWGHIP